MTSFATDVEGLFCPLCSFDFADCNPVALRCGHTICVDDARVASTCPVCNCDVGSEALNISETVKCLARCIRTLVLNGLRKRKLVSLLDLSGKLHPYVPSSSEKCLVCLMDFADRDAVTFPCGHSCCVKDSKRLTVCRCCRAELPPSDCRVVSPLVRETALRIREWGSGRPQLSPKASFRVEDVPESLCMVELVEMVNRPEVVVDMCSVVGCMNAANYVCGKCRSAYYCGKVHQQVHWTNCHSNVCSIARESGEYHGVSSVLSRTSVDFSPLIDYHTTGMPAWLQFSFNNRNESWRNIFYALSQIPSPSGSVDCVGASLCITAEGIAESLYIEVLAVKIAPLEYFTDGRHMDDVIPLLVVKYCLALHSEARLSNVKHHPVPALHLTRCAQYLQTNELMIDDQARRKLANGMHSMFRVSFAVPYVKLLQTEIK